MATNQCVLDQNKLNHLLTAQGRMEQRIFALEDGHKEQGALMVRVEGKLDRITWWLISTLVAACGGLLVALGSVVVLYLKLSE